MRHLEKLSISARQRVPVQNFCSIYKTHLRDHLQCAAVIADKCRLPAVSYLVGLAIAAAQETKN